MSIMITDKNKIDAVRLLSLRQALKFEMNTGMRMSSKIPSALSIIKKEFGLKGKSKKVLQEFTDLLTEHNILIPDKK